jgi:hypothetical protein
VPAPAKLSRCVCEPYAGWALQSVTWGRNSATPSNCGGSLKPQLPPIGELELITPVLEAVHSYGKKVALRQKRVQN